MILIKIYDVDASWTSWSVFNGSKMILDLGLEVSPSECPVVVKVVDFGCSAPTDCDKVMEDSVWPSLRLCRDDKSPAVSSGVGPVFLVHHNSLSYRIRSKAKKIIVDSKIEIPLRSSGGCQRQHLACRLHKALRPLAPNCDRIPLTHSESSFQPLGAVSTRWEHVASSSAQQIYTWVIKCPHWTSPNH